jgi:hydrogenase maturation protease
VSAVPAGEPVVIGVGNRLRGDDGAGLEVARLVREQVGPSLRVLELDGEPGGLLEAWEGADLAVVIDTSDSGVEEGTVRRFEAAREPLPAGVGASSTHALGPADAIELARALGRLPTRLTVYTIEGKCFEPGAPPGSAVREAIRGVAEDVIAEVTH